MAAWIIPHWCKQATNDSISKLKNSTTVSGIDLLSLENRLMTSCSKQLSLYQGLVLIEIDFTRTDP